MPIGGVKEKVLAAYRSGIRTVILPKKNEPDLLEDLPKELRDQMTFVFATDITEVLDTALEGGLPGARKAAGEKDGKNGTQERHERARGRKVEKAVAQA